jgi:hypothetical protein
VGEEVDVAQLQDLSTAVVVEQQPMLGKAQDTIPVLDQVG